MKTEETDVVIAEFTALRNEILKREEFRYLLINLTLIVAGTFLSVGLQPNISASFLLVYPIIALFLAAAWAHNGNLIVRVGRYIRERLEAKSLGLGWESYLKEQAFPRPGFLGTISTSGLFLVTQFLSIGLAACRRDFFAVNPICGKLRADSVDSVVLSARSEAHGPQVQDS